jgi:hypothetical protein
MTTKTEKTLQTYKVHVIELDRQGIDAHRQDCYDSPWDVEASDGYEAIREAIKSLKRLATVAHWDIEHDYRFVARLEGDDYDPATEVWCNAPVSIEDSAD